MAQVQRVIPQIYLLPLIVHDKFVCTVVHPCLAYGKVHARPVHFDSPRAAHQQQVQVLFAARHALAVQVFLVYLRPGLAPVCQHRAAVGLLVQVALQQRLHGLRQFQIRGPLPGAQQLFQILRLFQYVAACKRLKQPRNAVFYVQKTPFNNLCTRVFHLCVHHFNAEALQNRGWLVPALRRLVFLLAVAQPAQIKGQKLAPVVHINNIRYAVPLYAAPQCYHRALAAGCRRDIHPGKNAAAGVIKGR